MEPGILGPSTQRLRAAGPGRSSRWRWAALSCLWAAGLLGLTPPRMSSVSVLWHSLAPSLNQGWREWGPSPESDPVTPAVALRCL